MSATLPSKAAPEEPSPSPRQAPPSQNDTPGLGVPPSSKHGRVFFFSEEITIASIQFRPLAPNLVSLLVRQPPSVSIHNAARAWAVQILRPSASQLGGRQGTAPTLLPLGQLPVAAAGVVRPRLCMHLPWLVMLSLCINIEHGICISGGGTCLQLLGSRPLTNSKRNSLQFGTCRSHTISKAESCTGLQTYGSLYCLPLLLTVIPCRQYACVIFNGVSPKGSFCVTSPAGIA